MPITISAISKAMPKMRFNSSRLSSTTGKPICAIADAAPNS